MDAKTFLNHCTDEEYRDVIDERHALIGRPWTLTWRGELWTAATNGRYMVVIRGSHSDHEATARHEKSFKSVLDMPAKSLGCVSLATLKTFLGKPVSLKKLTCGECGGSGQTLCPHCEQDMKCDECSGSGQRMESRDLEPVKIGPCHVDRHKVSHAIRIFQDKEVELLADADMVRIQADGWIAIVMGMRVDDVDAIPEEFQIVQPAAT